jgi:hypothetical protein
MLLEHSRYRRGVSTRTSADKSIQHTKNTSIKKLKNDILLPKARILNFRGWSSEQMDCVQHSTN